MKVFIPYTAKRSPMIDAVRICLMHERCKPHYRLMENDDSYYELVKSLWEKGEPFIVNEHDIVSWPGAIQQLKDCPEPWCTFPYRAGCGMVKQSLGLAKFIPQLLINVFADITYKHWGGLDMEIAKRLRTMFSPHVHEPPVTNLNPHIWLTSA